LWFLTLTKGLELRTAYEHRMAESERAVGCVRLGLRRASSSVVRAVLGIAAGQLLGRGNRGDLLWIGLLFVSLQAETFGTGLWERIEPVSCQEEEGT